MKDCLVELWNRENRPYALEFVTKRYDGLIGYYDGILKKLEQARRDLTDKHSLPPAASVGLEVVEKGARPTRPT